MRTTVSGREGTAAATAFGTSMLEGGVVRTTVAGEVELVLACSVAAWRQPCLKASRDGRQLQPQKLKSTVSSRAEAAATGASAQCGSMERTTAEGETRTAAMAAADKSEQHGDAGKTAEEGETGTAEAAAAGTSML